MKSIRASVLGALFLCAPFLAWAGPLTPPPGAPASTDTALRQTDPRTPIGPSTTPGDGVNTYRIAQPGSYYLAGNLVGESGKSGIGVFASGVTIDLNGFTVQGVAGSGSGITASGTFDGVHVLNGQVRGWGGNGVLVVGEGCRIAGVLSAENAATGIAIGTSSVVESCTSTSNGIAGFSIGTNSLARGCSAYLNQSAGFSNSANAVIESCTARQNVGNGFSTGFGAVVVDCSSRANGGAGYSIGTGGVVSRCSAYQNTGSGFSLGGGARLESSSADSNTLDGVASTSASVLVQGTIARANGQSGIALGSLSTVRNCQANDNAANGIVVGSDCLVADSEASSNGTNGISMTNVDRTTVTRCFVNSNNTDGIEAFSADQCVFTDNTLSNNGVVGTGRGLHLDNGSCWIQGNRFYGNDIGVDAPGFHFIVSNVFGSNGSDFLTNFGMFGPTFFYSVGTSLTVTSPYANFRH